MATNDAALAARARRAYEMGRLRGSLSLLPLVLCAALAAVAGGRPLAPTAAIAFVLAALAAGLSFRGGDAGRAVPAGLAGGLFALTPPVLLHSLGHACFGPSCLMLGVPACVAGGALGGLWIARRAATAGEGARYLLAAVAVAGLTGSLGCSLAGVAGVLGMLAGTLAAGAPLLLAARR